MKAETYKNRYGDEYTFTPDEDGNVLWEGEFKWYRIGYPNDYTNAYSKYLEDGEPLGFMNRDTFEEKVHEYDDEKREYVMKDYVQLVESRTDKISMVDPSGGPYLAIGMKSTMVHSEIKNKEIMGFYPIKTGYKVILG